MEFGGRVDYCNGAGFSRKGAKRPRRQEVKRSGKKGGIEREGSVQRRAYSPGTLTSGRDVLRLHFVPMWRRTRGSIGKTQDPRPEAKDTGVISFLQGMGAILGAD